MARTRYRMKSTGTTDFRRAPALPSETSLARLDVGFKRSHLGTSAWGAMTKPPCATLPTKANIHPKRITGPTQVAAVQAVVRSRGVIFESSPTLARTSHCCHSSFHWANQEGTTQLTNI